MSVNELVPGDLLKRQKSSVWHLGVYLGNDRVLHNCPAPSGGECITSFADFAKDALVYVQQLDPQSRNEIIQRARQIVVNPRPYSYLWRNCEHTFYEIVEGVPRSPTVKTLAYCAIAAGLSVLTYKYRKEIAQLVRHA
ncbi:MAG TPA: lecithin retinol acyltransferase family protein [Gammaproteobacteria bacterium]|nr:lecithin retinol acyltransferase family protein [Gammaproteobacteria bacterium]